MQDSICPPKPDIMVAYSKFKNMKISKPSKRSKTPCVPNADDISICVFAGADDTPMRLSEKNSKKLRAAIAEDQAGRIKAGLPNMFQNP